jgi:hypothetical protein
MIERQLWVPKPHSKKQSLIISACLDPEVLEIWVPCGTKFGKTASASMGVSSRLMIRKGSLGRWIAPIYSQAKIGFKYCRRILPTGPEIDINKSEPSITMIPNDMKVEFKSGVNPEDLEGEATDFNILDEASKMSQQVYDSVKTTTTVTRGLIAGFSTPRGKNWFYTKCMLAKERMEHDIRRGRKPTHLFITAPSSENPYVTTEAVEEARRSLPDRLFRQYFLAEFLDDGAVFVGYQDCVEKGPPLLFDGRHQKWYHQDAEHAPVVVGADWAKTHDRTVFWAIDLRTRRTVGFQRFYKTPYTEAIRKLQLFCKKFHDVVAVLHDKTGLGQVIDDYLAQTELPYQGVTFTPQSKTSMVTQLITGIEQQDLWIPNWQEALGELDAYEVKTTLAGNMTYSAPTGKHDDIVCAMMLAYTALLQYGDVGMEIQYTDESPSPTPKPKPIKGEEDSEPVSALERFYLDLQDDVEFDD